MGLNDWSDRIVIAELADEPAFSEDMDALLDRIERTPAAQTRDIIVDLSAVNQLNSTNIAQLLRLRKRVALAGKAMRVCGANDHVWSIFLTANIDTLFAFNGDVATSLASLQIDE